MRGIIQRVTNASVTVDGNTVGEIGQGILILLGVSDDDTEADMKYIADKAINLRIFSDDNDKMNLSVKDINGEILVVSQFTLYGDCRKGRRPSFDSAGSPDYANSMYENFIKYCEQSGLKVQHGIFGADMKVSLLNDGPVTIMLDSTKLF